MAHKFRPRYLNHVRLGGFVVDPIDLLPNGKDYGFRVETCHLAEDRVITTLHDISVSREFYNSSEELRVTGLGHYVCLKGLRLPSQKVSLFYFRNIILPLQTLDSSHTPISPHAIKHVFRHFSENEMRIGGFVISKIKSIDSGRGYTFQVKTIYPLAGTDLRTIHTVFIQENTYLSCAALRATKPGEYVYIEGLFSANKHIVVNNFVNFSLIAPEFDHAPTVCLDDSRSS